VEGAGSRAGGGAVQLFTHEEVDWTAVVDAALQLPVARPETTSSQVKKARVAFFFAGPVETAVELGHFITERRLSAFPHVTCTLDLCGSAMHY
jgi:hypothetical protein